MNTDWNEIITFWNGVYGTKFKTIGAVLRAGVKKFHTIKKLALKLDINRETLRRKMRRK
jgi:hypothetical protein